MSDRLLFRTESLGGVASLTAGLVLLVLPSDYLVVDPERGFKTVRELPSNDAQRLGVIPAG